MTDDLKRLVQGTRGQPPSPEFRARLRARIVAETEARPAGAHPVSGDAAIGDGRAPERDDRPGHEPADDIAMVIDLMSTHEEHVAAAPDDDLGARRTRRSRRFQLLTLAAATVVLAGLGAWVLISQDDGAELDNVTTELPDGDVATGEPVTAGNTYIDAGTFRIDTLGTAFTFEVDQTTGVLRNDNGIVSITDLRSRNADDRTITFRRTGLLPDPTAPTMPVSPDAGWTATDLSGWLAAVGDDVVAGDPRATTLGGAEATFVELDFPCGGGNCSPGDLVADPDLPMFTAGSRYQLWLVDQGEEDPIVVLVAIDDDSDVAWLEQADAILSSLDFESTEPNPVRLTAGATDLQVFDGVRIELPDGATVIEPHNGFARVIPPDIGGDVEFLTRPLDSEGVEVASTEELMELLNAEAVELTELETLDIGGLGARALGVTAGPFPNIVLKTRPAELVRSEFGWEPPQFGYLWVVEHPDRGLLIVGAEALDGPQSAEPLRTWTEEVLRSLEFRAS